MYLIAPNKRQYKANLHCHSTWSDGHKTPEELKAMYQKRGYSVLAITDHEVPKSHSYLSGDNFIMITGYENYIREAEDGAYDTYGKEIHLNLFAREPENEAMVCYNDCYCKYMDDEAKAALKKVGSQRPRVYSGEYINEYIRTAQENGYLVAYNHPVWSMETEADILAYEGYFSLEMCNYGSYLVNHLEYNGALYDKMLCAGKKVFCHSADDNHNEYPEGRPECDSFGGFTMLMPEEFTYAGIIEAMEKGEMYSSMGPLFQEVSVEGGRLHIECSEVERIYVFYGGKSPDYVLAEEGRMLTEADFTIPPSAKYVRVSIWDNRGRAADTRGFFREELGL